MDEIPITSVKPGDCVCWETEYRFFEGALAVQSGYGSIYNGVIDVPLSLSPNAKGKNTGVFGHSRGFGGCLEHASRNCCNGHNKLVTIVIQWR